MLFFIFKNQYIINDLVAGMHSVTNILQSFNGFFTVITSKLCASFRIRFCEKQEGHFASISKDPKDILMYGMDFYRHSMVCGNL